MQTSIDGFNPCSGCNVIPSFIFFPPLFLMLCEIAGIEPTYRTMNPIKQMLRSSQTGAFCLKHKKINEENSSHAIASKIDINTISITSMIENILNAFFMFLPPLSFLRSTINYSGSALTYVLPDNRRP